MTPDVMTITSRACKVHRQKKPGPEGPGLFVEEAVKASSSSAGDQPKFAAIQVAAFSSAALVIVPTRVAV